MRVGCIDTSSYTIQRDNLILSSERIWKESNSTIMLHACEDIKFIMHDVKLR